MIIGLSGYAQSGKDTVAGFLKNFGYTRVAFADPMRTALYSLNPLVSGDLRLAELVDQIGWDGAKTAYPEIRRLLQVFGTEVGRNQWGSNFWVDLAMTQMDWLEKDYVVTDVRFPNEYEAIKATGGKVWRVDRTAVGPVNEHVSDNALEGFEFDRVVKNYGTLRDLQFQVEALLP